MAKESYNDLIFQLGDLARDRLPGKPNCPRTMDRVYRAEEALVARRDELAALEQQMNEEDASYQDFLAQQDGEKAKLEAVVKKWQKIVDVIDSKVRASRKKLSSRRADLRYAKEGLETMEKKLAEMEELSEDPRKIVAARENLKKSRLTMMRTGREVEDLEYEVNQLLTPEPGKPGAAGIQAFKRLMDLEDEAEERRAANERTMAELDQAVAAKEEEIKAAEDYLDQALFLLGEDVYAQRIADAQLAPFYPRLDRAQ
jgi:chromosome segregation ATPase